MTMTSEPTSTAAAEQADQTEQELQVERDGSGVATVTLNRPRTKNAVTGAGWLAIADVFEDIARRPDDRVVILTGAGGNFCSGADLSARGGTSAREGMRRVNAASAAVRDLPKPTIAVVSGVAVGAGFNLALACDLAIADRSARFSQIFSLRGLSVDFGGTWQLPHNIGLQRAKELAFFGRMYGAEEIAEFGLLNRVVDEGDAMPLAEEWALELTRIAPTALSQTKELLNAAAASTFEEALSREAIAQNFNGTTADTREAIDAFLQKREPRFGGS